MSRSRFRPTLLMPKRRMQSLEASKNYKNSFVCAAKIFKDEGVLTFWSGAMPRLARLIMSGGIVFTMSVYPNPAPSRLLTANLWEQV